MSRDVHVIRVKKPLVFAAPVLRLLYFVSENAGKYVLLSFRLTY
jgi:hypothetical protein